MPVEDSLSLTTLLETGMVSIPEYQREYDWDNALVKNLWNDLAICIDEDGASSDYFLGNIMVHIATEGITTKWDVVDGQQRLVTLTLFAAVVRDKLIELGEYRLAHDLQDSVLWKENSEEPFLIPRPKTKKLLRPAQLPLKQSVNFKFKDDIATPSSGDDAYHLSEQVIAKFYIPRQEKIELSPEVYFTPAKDYLPGDELSPFLGTLFAPNGLSSEQRFTLSSKRHQELIIMQPPLSGSWPYKGLRRHYKTNIPKLFDARYKDVDRDYKKSDLTNWSNLLKRMKFTLTKFQNDDDAIYYFGKLNDSESRLQLNSGDLMRHFVITTSKKTPEDATYDQQIRDQWEQIESVLKDDDKKNEISLFMRNWLIATGHRATEKKAYSKMKSLCTEKYFSIENNQWKKKEFYEFLLELTNSSNEFAEIVYPEDTSEGPNRMIFDALNRNYKQHLSFFLAGSMGFLRHGQTDSFNRLIRIFEYLVVKGNILPGLAGDEVMSIASQDVYSWAEKFGGDVYLHSNSYTTNIPIAQVKNMLDDLANKVKTACKNIWSGSSGWEWDPETLPGKLYEESVNQNEAKLILTRIELHEAGVTKTWSPEVQVEHIAPKAWNHEYNDRSKGGGFSLDVDGDNKLTQASKVEYNDYKDRIGNKTLLSPTTNNNLDNMCFTSKKQHEKHGYEVQSNSWKVTEQLLRFDVWGPNEIDGRSKKIMKKIIEIFDETYLD